MPNLRINKGSTAWKIFNSDLISITLLVVIVTIDAMVPPGTALGMVYFITLCFLQGAQTRKIFHYAILISILIILNPMMYMWMGYELHTSVYVDRALSLLVLWTITPLRIRYKKLLAEKEALKNQQLHSIKKTLFKVNHEVRHCTAQIMGLSLLLEKDNLTIEEIHHIGKLMQKPATELDHFTRELSDHLSNENYSMASAHYRHHAVA